MIHLFEVNEPLLFRNYDRKGDHKLVNVPYVDNSYKWSGGGFLSNVEELLKLGNCMLSSSQTDQGIVSSCKIIVIVGNIHKIYKKR